MSSFPNPVILIMVSQPTLTAEHPENGLRVNGKISKPECEAFERGVYSAASSNPIWGSLEVLF